LPLMEKVGEVACFGTSSHTLEPTQPTQKERMRNLSHLSHLGHPKRSDQPMTSPPGDLGGMTSG